MLEGGTGENLAKKGWIMVFMPYLAKNGLKLEFLTKLKSDKIGRDMPQKSDVPGVGWGDG